MKIALLKKIFIPLFIVLLCACRQDIVSPDEIVTPEAKKGGELDISMSNADAFIRRAMIRKRADFGYRISVEINTSELGVAEVDAKIKVLKGAPSPSSKKLTLQWEESDPITGISIFSNDMLDFDDDAVGKTYEVTFTLLDDRGKKIGKVKKEELTVEAPEVNLPELVSIKIIKSERGQWTCSVVMSDPVDALDYVEIEFLENNGPAPSNAIIALTYIGEVNLDQELYVGTLSFEGDPTRTNYNLLVHGFDEEVHIITIETFTTPINSDLPSD